MIRALFFDLDGTLLTSRKTLQQSTKAALQACREKGIKIFLATARSPMLDKMLGWSNEEFALFDGGIYCNGAYERIGQHTEYAFLDPHVVSYCVTRVAHYPDVHIALHTEHEIHAFNHPLPDFALDPWGLTRDEIVDITECCYSRTVKVLIYHDNLIDATKPLPPELFQQINAHCSDSANIYLSDQGKTIQVVKKNISKFTSIENVRRTLGLSRDEIAVFGDDLNDMEMLSGCPNSVAMGNAEPQVREVAAYTTKTNDDDGIAFALEKILSII